MNIEQVTNFQVLTDKSKLILKQRDNSKCISREENPDLIMHNTIMEEINFQIFSLYPTRENAKIIVDNEYGDILRYVNVGSIYATTAIIDEVLWLGYDLDKKFSNISRDKVICDIRLDTKRPIEQGVNGIEKVISRLEQEYAKEETHEIVPPTFKTMVTSPEYNIFLNNRDNRKCFSVDEREKLTELGIYPYMYNNDNLKIFSNNPNNNNAYKLVHHGFHDDWLTRFFRDPQALKSEFENIDISVIEEIIWRAYNLEEKFPGIDKKKIIDDLRAMSTMPTPQKYLWASMEYYINLLSRHYESENLIEENGYNYPKIQSALLEYLASGITEESVNLLYDNAYAEMKILEKDFINIGVPGTIESFVFLKIINIRYDLEKKYPGKDAFEIYINLSGSKLSDFNKPLEFQNQQVSRSK